MTSSVTRRGFLTGAAGFTFAGATAASAFTDAMLGGDLDQGFVIPPELAAQRVRVQTSLPVGSIQVMTASHWLYFIANRGDAIRYPIAVGLAGRQFRGAAHVGDKIAWPFWQPTRNMIRREPQVYGPYASGVQGGPDNPLGARALYLYRGSRDTLYRIHGTSQPWSIGMEGSSGCIRLFNSHIADLYARVPIGTRVYAH